VRFLKRYWGRILGGICLGAAALAGLMWWMTMQPMYQPGDVRAGRNLRAPLDPPAQVAGDTWRMEPGIWLHHFSAGAGRNVLVLHGGPGIPTQAAWPGLERLGERYRFHYFDQRGCGTSSRPFDRFASKNYFENMVRLERTLGLGALIADVERIRRITGDDRAILVGHSFGGLLAALYAAEFPHRVAALVLIDPASVLRMPGAGGDLFTQVRDRLPAAERADYDRWLRGYLDFGRIFDKSESDLVAEQIQFFAYYRAALGAALPPLAENTAGIGGWGGRAAFFSLGRRHDWSGALRSVTAPVLVVHGRDDLQPEAASRLYAAALPNAQFRVIEGAGHFPQVEKPAEFARVVGEFLQAHAQ
jgi:proline iminopeptidase